MRRVAGILAVVCALALAASASAAKPSIEIGKLRLAGSGLDVTLSCKGAPCRGTLVLATVPPGKGTRKVLAKGTYKVSADHQKPATAKLTPRGRSILAAILHGKAKPFPAKLTATVVGGAPQSQSIKFP